jgi:DNA polymerase-3 subunit beta
MPQADPPGGSTRDRDAGGQSGPFPAGIRFRCERDVLADALATASRAVASRGGSLPALSGLRFELDGQALRVTGSDLDLTITVRLGVAGGRSGTAVIPAKLVAEIVRSLEPGKVEIEADDEEARISAGRSDFTVRTIPAHEYPQLAQPAADTVELEAAAFAEALGQVVPAASLDDARPILTGVLMAAEDGGLRLVATDSYRLGVRDLPGSAVLREGQEVIVPSKALGELRRLLGEAETVRLRLGEREVAFEVGDVVLSTRLIEGEFPKYRSLIPQSHPNRLRVGRTALLDALRRVRLLAREGAHVRLRMKPDELELQAVTQDVGEAHEVVDATYEGEELTVAFNPEYLIAGIEATPGEEIVLETVDNLKPALIHASDGLEFLYLLMPVRVNVP